MNIDIPNLEATAPNIPFESTQIDQHFIIQSDSTNFPTVPIVEAPPLVAAEFPSYHHTHPKDTDLPLSDVVVIQHTYQSARPHRRFLPSSKWDRTVRFRGRNVTRRYRVGLRLTWLISGIIVLSIGGFTWTVLD